MFLIPEHLIGHGSVGKNPSQAWREQLVSGQGWCFEQVAPVCGSLLCTLGSLGNWVESAMVYSSLAFWSLGLRRGTECAVCGQRGDLHTTFASLCPAGLR